MIITHNGIEIELEFDGDGFPIIRINTGSSFIAERNRPTVEVTLNGQLIHDMFDDDDTIWE